MKLSIHYILTNTYVLYLISLLSLLQLFTYIYRNKMDSAIVYVLMTYIVYTFTTNMILILGIPLLITRFIALFSIEGFKDKDSKEEETKLQTSNLAEEVDLIEPVSDQDLSEPHVGEDNLETLDNMDNNQLESIDNLNPSDYEQTTSDDLPNKKSKHLPKSDNKVRPKPSKVSGNKVNYATTYMSNLKKYNDILGKDGLFKMTEHTKDLMQQQNQLGESIAKIVPLIQQMTPFLKTAGSLFTSNNISNIDNL